MQVIWAKIKLDDPDDDFDDVHDNRYINARCNECELEFLNINLN